jgi:type I restriction enzyme M protein
MVNLLFIEDTDALTRPGIVRTLYDPACCTGGMLSVAEDHMRDLNPGARLEVFEPGGVRPRLPGLCNSTRFAPRSGNPSTVGSLIATK